MKKVVFRAAAVALALSSAPAFAADEVSLSASVTGVSEYFFRGISQSDSNPALQAGLEGSMDITEGLSGYLGIWGSTVDFNNGTDAEIDFYGGFRYAIGDLGFDLGAIRYHYVDDPATSNYDFTEFKLLASYDFGFMAPSAGIYYSPQYYGGSGTAVYYTAGVTVPIPVTEFEPRIVANVGRQTIDNNSRWGTEDYVDWNIGLFASYMGFTAGIQYVDNNIDTNDAANTSCTTGVCEAAAVVSLGYSYSF